MIALLYLGLVVLAGDAVARRCFTYVSLPHRLATAFLVGLLLSTWLTYLASLASMAVDQPLVPGNLVAVGVMGIVLVPDIRGALARWRRGERALGAWLGAADPSHRHSEEWGWTLIGVIAVLVAGMMVATFTYADNRLWMGVHEWGDLGPGVALAQSFVLGHNFPTEYPLFTGEPIRYHFLFQFQVGNLTFLGLDPASANNILSVGSMLALLILVMALGERLFRSALVGRLAALLFFAHGSLSFIPFLASFPSPSAALDGIAGLDHYLVSGFPYHGEDWAVWSQNVFLNQRHLASAIGVMVLVVVFLVDRLAPAGRTELDPDLGDMRAGRAAIGRPMDHVRLQLRDPALPGYLLCGVLLGLLPLWNSAIYLACAAILGVWLVALPNRIQMLAMAAPAALLSIPQLLFLRAGSGASSPFPTFHWGYVVDDPTLVNVATYIGFIFGPKLVLASVALVAGTRLQRRVFVAVSALFGLTFLVQLTPDIVASHKLLNAWLIIANVFVAYGLVRLWQGFSARRGRSVLPSIGRLVAVALVAVIAIGGVIDLFPIRNDRLRAWRLDGDPLYDWVRQETEPSDIFLSDVHIVDPILLAGRRLYFGWPVYAWSAGYDTYGRDRVYRAMLEERSLPDLVRLLRDNRIAYVAIDDGLRKTSYADDLNEELYLEHFEPVFEDAENGHLVIYRVPTGAP